MRAPRARLAAAVLGLASGSWWSRRDEGRDRLARVEGRVADISPVDVEEQQRKWGDGIVEIGRLYQKHSFPQVKEYAFGFAAEIYGTDFSNVIVKPTGVLHEPFRDTSRGVVSWLIGHDPEYPQDQGFATFGWQNVRFRNAGITLTGNEALAMGHSFFRHPVTGHESQAEYTMGFIRDADEEIRMNLHFSSIPFDNTSESAKSQGITQEDVEQAQIGFVNDIIRIGRRGDVRRRVERFVDNTFAYGSGEVLFKPPDVEDVPFRTTRYGIYSYFAGASDEYPEDRGFATEEWSSGNFHNAAVVLDGDQAWAMGIYSFGKEDGEDPFHAEFSMGYVRDSEDRLRINLFSASMPSEMESGRHKKEAKEDCWGTRVSATAIEDLQRDIEDLQKEWAKGIIDIGSTYATKGDYKRRAEQFVDKMYAYQTRPVLYKPADASGWHAFRTSREGAVSYFVAGDQSFPEDEGFALNCWQHVHFTNVDAIYAVDMVMTMGFVSYASSNGIWRTAEITMGFILDEEGQLRINMQHATFPDRAKRWRATAPGRLRYGVRRDLSKELIEGAQEEWGHWIVRIAKAGENWTKARLLAEEMMDKLYDFKDGQVLFNVIDAPNSSRFRYTRREAISFLVGGDCNFPEDAGFALEHQWSKVSFRNHGIKVLENHRANIFGTSYFCCDRHGKEREVDYTMGYLSGVDGRLRIFLHDMAKPYEAEADPSTLGTVFRHASHVASSFRAVGSRGPSAVAAVFVIPLVAGVFLYFACCWNAGKLAAGAGAGARQSVGKAGQAGYTYDNGYDQSAYANQRGGYSRSAGPGNGFAGPASMGYQDPGDRYGMYAPQGSAYPNQYEPVPSRSFYPQPMQSRRSAAPGNPARSSWRSAGAMPQRAYNMQ